MKKLFAILLAVAVICALSVTAFAAQDPTEITTIPAQGATATVTVKGQYAAAAADIHNYKVVITWGDMEFKYTPAQREWNTTTHNWDNKPGGGWSVVESKSNTISIANHSSKAIEASFAFEAAQGFTGVNGTFTGLTEGKLNLAAPQAGATDPVTDSVTFMPNAGTLTAETAAEPTTIGTITVTVK